MDFGVQVNSNAYPKLRGYVQEAERLGYAAMYMPDHFIYETVGGGFDPEQPVFEALTMLAGLAEATETIRLGTHVLCTPFRHPALEAKMLTTLDHISDGRLIAGFGAGWTRAEFDMMGFEFLDVSTRLRIMEEHLHVCKALWTEATANFRGEFFTITDGVAMPKPVQQPYPTVLLGGNGNGVLRRAGRLADMVNIVVSLGEHGTMKLEEATKLTGATFRKKVGVVRAEQEKAGRAADAVRVSTTIFQFMLTDSPDTTRAVHENLSGMYGLPPEEVAQMPMLLVGTRDEIVETLKRREAEWELDHVILSANSSREMRQFGEEIVSAFEPASGRSVA